MELAKSKGNMYPWVTHMHSHLGGKCEHNCKYCYVQTGPAKSNTRNQGPVRLLEDELCVRYGAGKTIFVEHMNDIFGPGVEDAWMQRILSHCCCWPDNTYVFQSKRPAAFEGWAEEMPDNCIFGTTIETNRDDLAAQISDAPPPSERAAFMGRWEFATRKFVTIEPVMDFDVDILAGWIARINPEFLNLGADSKDNGLPEPSVEKIEALVAALAGAGIELREKYNLHRLRQTD
jgi:DNA repair photolyase